MSEPTSTVATYSFEALRKGRRCGIDNFGFFLGANDDRNSARAVEGLPGVDKPAEGGSISELQSEARRQATVSAVQAEAPRVGVAWWQSVAQEVVAEGHRRNAATRAQRHQRATGADSPDRCSVASSSRGEGGEHSVQASWSKVALLKARRRVRRGALPMEERKVAWQLLTGSLFAPVTAAEFEGLQSEPIPQESEEVMMRDLGRTLPLHCLFKDEGSPGQESLRRVLHAYCARDFEVGYCQGMGFIASVLLLHMEEPAAFGVLWQLMNGRHYLMRQLYQPGFPLLQKMLEILRSLLRRYLPRLHDHFADLNIEPAFYASHWFLTLYAYQFPVPLVCRIWDLFVSEGWKIIFKVAVALLQWEEPQLLSMSMENILLLVKTIQDGKDPEAIIARAMSLPIKERDLWPDPPVAPESA